MACDSSTRLLENGKPYKKTLQMQKVAKTLKLQATIVARLQSDNRTYRHKNARKTKTAHKTQTGWIGDKLCHVCACATLSATYLRIKYALPYSFVHFIASLQNLGLSCFKFET